MSVASDASCLGLATVERILDRLGLSGRPQVSRDGLEQLYRAWCRSVPFDNVLRRIQIASGAGRRLPGKTPAEFFAALLRDGVGGPCAPASMALGALLRDLGFAPRGLLAAIDGGAGLVPDHATLVVPVDGGRFLVDTVILCEHPLPLPAAGGATLPGTLHSASAERRGQGWRVEYLAPMTRSAESCTVLEREADAAALAALYEATQRSPTFVRFNAGLYVRLNGPGSVAALYRDRHVVVDARGRRERQLGAAERRRTLTGDFGLSPRIVARLPEDSP